VIWATSTFDMERGSELGDRRRERRKIESEGGSECGSKKEKSSVRENRTSGAKRVGFAKVRAPSIALSHAFHPLAHGWYMVRWVRAEPHSTVSCMRTYNPCCQSIPWYIQHTKCPKYSRHPNPLSSRRQCPCYEIPMSNRKPSPRRRVPKRPFYPNAVQNTMPCYILCYVCSEDVKSGLA
jgi:hypothetical protein